MNRPWASGLEGFRFNHQDCETRCIHYYVEPKVLWPIGNSYYGTGYLAKTALSSGSVLKLPWPKQHKKSAGWLGW